MDEQSAISYPKVNDVYQSLQIEMAMEGNFRSHCKSTYRFSTSQVL